MVAFLALAASPVTLAAEAESALAMRVQQLEAREAIRAQLEGAFSSNSMGIGSPNFHIFFNESIRVDGDRATAISKGAFVAPGEIGRPQMIILATYDDVLIREGGQWKFLRRVVRGDLPAPRAPVPIK